MRHRENLELRVSSYLATHPQTSPAQASYVARVGIRKWGESGVLALGRLVKRVEEGLEDGRDFLTDRLLKGPSGGLMDDCLRQGDVEGAVKAYYGRRSQKAQGEPRGPFPITDVQSSWLKGLLRPMPEPRAWDYWTLSKTA